ncbi:MAG TPA: DMT family transporter [Phycisphaerae bacterium]|nr:DMT family transporter [Phycisphaerae bacterium]
MPHQQLIGETCAVLTALTWAFALVFFKRSGDRVQPLALNLFKNTVGLALLFLTLLVLWIAGHGEEDIMARRDAHHEIGILFLSGFIGIALADTIFFYALNLIGVGIVAIVDCLYSPLIILFSVLMLSEKLGRFQYIGAALVLCGVLVSSRLAPPRRRTRGQLILGITMGASSMAMMAFGIVLAKPVLEGYPLFWATTLRLLAGTLSLAVFGLCLPERKVLFSVFRPSRVWKSCLPGSILGAYASLVFWIAGFKYIEASIAGILNQTSTMFAIILATLMLKEEFTRRKLLAVSLALAGVIMVTLDKQLSGWLGSALR